ncbi:MAG: hypothetical protein ACRDYZ_07775 [Acidimicrobiales bacterium]
MTAVAMEGAGTNRVEQRKRRLAVVLGVVWLFDAALQAQPFMFGHRFPRQVIDGAATGQPIIVAAPLHWFANLLVSAPWIDAFFVIIQLAIGLMLLARRWRRPALLASAGWAIGVWYFGDGLGGILGGHTTLLTGFPSAPLVYVAVSLALWPSPVDRSVAAVPVLGRSPRWRQVDAALGRRSGLVAIWSWVGLWTVAGLFRLLPGQHTAGAVGSTLSSMAATAAPGVGSLDRLSAHLGGSLGLLVVALLAAGELAIGVGALHRRWRPWAVGAGAALSLLFWVFGQNFGGISTGTATDVAAAPIYILLAAVIATTVPGALTRGKARARSVGSAMAGEPPAERFRRQAS